MISFCSYKYDSVKKKKGSKNLLILTIVKIEVVIFQITRLKYN